jgi:phytoene dehydrogenase-like protein
MSQQKRSAIVIGGGVSGLSAACYLQMSGYQARVFEMAGQVGGVSVSWKRKGYTFDGATNWLPGSGPSVNLHDILAEVIDFSELQLIDFPVFCRIELPGGAYFDVYKDVEKLRAEMLRIAPEDRRHVDAFCDAVERVGPLPLPLWKAPEVFGVADYLRAALGHWRMLAFLLHWRGTTIEQYAARFTNSNLRQMLQMIFPRHAFFSVAGLMISLGWMCRKSAAYPIGGSEHFNRVLMKRVLALGATVQLNSRVAAVIVAEGRAQGVRLADGSEYRADVVISAADGYETLKRLLPANVVPQSALGRFGTLKLYPGTLQVSLGLARTFADVPNKIVMLLKEPLVMGTDTLGREVIVRTCSFDPTMAPPGKTAVIVNLRCHDADYWPQLRERDAAGYRAAKERVAEAVIDALEARLGNIRATLEACDVATPATYIRYTSTWQGSYQGWAPVPAMIGRSLKRTLPRLKDFYMTGQWVEVGGGLPRAVLSARNTVQVVCKNDKKPFVASNAGAPHAGESRE